MTQKKPSRNSKPSNKLEADIWSRGFDLVCGIDEAGRGAFAGPLVAAAVILPKRRIYRLRDSKTIPEKTRYSLSKYIRRIAISWAVSIVEVDVVNLRGIQSATYIGFKQAVENLKYKPHHLLVDYYRIPGINIPQSNFAYGDKISQSIAAASIIAKTTRDDLMKKLSQKNEFKVYGFDRNLGYGTLYHRSKIEELGISSIHRINFGNLKRFVASTTQPKSHTNLKPEEIVDNCP